MIIRTNGLQHYRIINAATRANLGKKKGAAAGGARKLFLGLLKDFQKGSHMLLILARDLEIATKLTLEEPFSSLKWFVGRSLVRGEKWCDYRGWLRE